mgnify:CR=1 FL=1
MRIPSLYLYSLLVLSPLLAKEDEKPSLSSFKQVEANLQDPSFKDGGLSTTHGGVITAPDIRIQAQKIHYINKTEDGEKIQRVEAEGYLLFEYKGRFFVGEKLEYDFIKGTGTLVQGRTSEGIWFVGGKKVVLEEDGTYSTFLSNKRITISFPSVSRTRSAYRAATKPESPAPLPNSTTFLSVKNGRN